MFLCLPNSLWADTNLAELAWHVDSMVELSKKINKMYRTLHINWHMLNHILAWPTFDQ